MFIVFAEASPVRKPVWSDATTCEPSVVWGVKHIVSSISFVHLWVFFLQLNLSFSALWNRLEFVHVMFSEFLLAYVSFLLSSEHPSFHPLGRWTPCGLWTAGRSCLSASGTKVLKTHTNPFLRPLTQQPPRSLPSCLAWLYYDRWSVSHPSWTS